MAVMTIPFLWVSPGHVGQIWPMRDEEEVGGSGFWGGSPPSGERTREEHQRGHGHMAGWAEQRMALSQGIYRPQSSLS